MMKRIQWIFVVAALFLLVVAGKKQPVTFFMVGDSTMANKDVSEGKPERGWGMMFANFFTEDVVVDNHARNGRSSKSFIDEGLWQNVLDKIKPGDYVFIQFGHNDEKNDPHRHTDPGTTFDENLRRMVKEAKAKGANPVLLNSVVRRIFNDSKTAVADDDLRANSSSTLQEGDSLVDTHGAYLLSPRRVAQEMNVPFVDANAVTHRLEQGLGPVKSKSLHVWYLPGEHPALPEGRQDNTHYNIHGAYTVAGLLAKEIVEAVPALKKYYRTYDLTVAADGSAQYMNLQDAVDAAPEGKRTTILLGPGKWTKPVVPKGKKIAIKKREGAEF